MRHGYLSTDNYAVYYYVTNLQGDVIRLVDANGNNVAYYEYDPYGRPLTAIGTLANINPLRYRGYVYDTETGFYYLQSRYYDPTIGRFLNADSQIAGVGGDVLGYNMFAYCMNNPVNMSDPTGNWPSWKQAFTAVAIVAVAVVVAAAVVAAAPAVAGAVAATASFYGASAAVTGALATATTIGCATVAGGALITGTNRAVEAMTGTNYGEALLGEETYNAVESTINFAAMMITSVPQAVPYPSTGRNEPNNLKEQIGMNLAVANPDKGNVIIPSLNDPRMPGWLGWQKYEMHFQGTGVTIHYVGNKFIPIYFDFKFK